jgi:hypothetical protein
MGLTTAGIKARMTRSLKILGSPSSDEQTDILADSLRKFISVMDAPIISESLVFSNAGSAYCIPETIKKIQDIRDSAGSSVVYSIDETASTITLQDSEATGVYTAYGTPRDIRTNMDDIIEAVSEDMEFVLWSYIQAFYHKWGHSDMFVTELQAADKLAHEERQSFNYNLNNQFVTVKTLDSTGKNIADASNAEGFTSDVSDQFESDL